MAVLSTKETLMPNKNLKKNPLSFGVMAALSTKGTLMLKKNKKFFSLLSFIQALQMNETLPVLFKVRMWQLFYKSNKLDFLTQNPLT